MLTVEQVEQAKALLSLVSAFVWAGGVFAFALWGAWAPKD